MYIQQVGDKRWTVFKLTPRGFRIPRITYETPRQCRAFIRSYNHYHRHGSIDSAYNLLGKFPR